MGEQKSKAEMQRDKDMVAQLMRDKQKQGNPPNTVQKERFPLASPHLFLEETFYVHPLPPPLHAKTQKE